MKREILSVTQAYPLISLIPSATKMAKGIFKSTWPTSSEQNGHVLNLPNIQFMSLGKS